MADAVLNRNADQRVMPCTAAVSLRRTLDPTFLNSVINDPSVRPWVGADGPLNIDALVGDPSNVALVTDHGGFILHRHEPGIYEVHSQFLPSGRGRHALAAMRDGFRYMFTRTDCTEVVTRVPDGNGGAEGLARLAGFTERFRREAVWGDLGVSYRSIGVERWALHDAEPPEWGHRFHEALENAKRAHGSTLPAHADDPAHDAIVGACFMMVSEGQAAKAVMVYNRWARLAGYATIDLVSLAPPTFDVGDAVVEWRDGEMEVLLCR